MNINDYIPLPLDDDILKTLTTEGHDWCHANGLVLREDNTGKICRSTPFALLPTPFPRSAFQQAVDVQDLMSELYFRVSQDHDFLVKVHEQAAETDEFIRLLLDIFRETIENDGPLQKNVLVIQRADYMCNISGNQVELKQIEVNNIAAGMSDFGIKASQLHKTILERIGYSDAFISNRLAKNDDIQIVGKAIHSAWIKFGKENSCVLIVVEDENMNQLDQRHVEYSARKHGVPLSQMFRLTLTEAYEKCTLSNDNDLIFNGLPVAVIYFRSGYSIKQYPTHKEKQARIMMEKSTAIKAPWIGLQLANTKKMQQVLSEEGVLERYIRDQVKVAKVRSTFAKMWSLDSIPDKELQDVLSHPNKYVLKPQTEGGHGNFYDKDLVSKIKEIKSEERPAYILMERMVSPTFDNYLVQKTTANFTKVVSELGVFGFCLGDRDNFTTETGGFLLRTKGSTVNEGGVHSGAAVVDSPFLYD